MDYEDLIESSDAILAAYDAPTAGEFEQPGQRIARLGRTIDEMPDIYRWFLTLQSYFDHWTDAAGDLNGTRSIEFKLMRQRRDAMERMASAAKKRYEGASRAITVIEGFDAEGMPRARPQS
jgi:hypothetical protein